MKGLVLEGGGTKGAYQIGAYKALRDLGIEFQGVAGTSIGALNGAYIIQNDIEDTTVLDLFAGSGAIGIEFLSRRAKQVYFCDKSSKAVAMIEKNLEKTKLKEKAIVYNKDYIDCINTVKNIKFDIIFLDPPYKEEFALDAIEKISNLQLLKYDGIIIIETDEPERDINRINNMNINYKIYDLRKYGRVSLIFLK